MKDESISVMRMGIEALVGTVLLFLIFIATYLGKGWFLKEQENEVIKAQFKINAEIYHLISGEDISGDDIIEFILKHDMRYDYYIIINSIRSTNFLNIKIKT